MRCSAATLGLVDDATYMVFAKSEADAVAKCRRMCELLGLEPLGRPLRPVGRDRWMARATELEPSDET